MNPVCKFGVFRTPGALGDIVITKPTQRRYRSAAVRRSEQGWNQRFFRNVSMKVMSKNVRPYPKCDDPMEMTSKNVKMRPKCDDLMKMMSKNVKMCPKCDEFMKMTPKNVKMYPKSSKCQNLPKS